MASVDASITGVPVTPSGEMLPHDSDDLGTGLAEQALPSLLPAHRIDGVNDIVLGCDQQGS